MQPPDKADDAARNGNHAPMPPVTSQPVRAVPSSADAPMAPPFTSQPTRFSAASEEPLLDITDIEPMQWPDMSEEGTVEPAFEADVFATEATLAELSREQTKVEEEFPLDAFIIPQDTQHVPTGVQTQEPTEVPEPTATDELSARLEKLSHRLRVEDTDTLLARLAAGDRLDAMLAGLLAGYLAGSK